MVLEALVSAILEPDFSVLAAFALEPTLVHQAVMVPAQQDEVVETGFTAIGPVFDVMTVDELRMDAARVATAAIAGLQGTACGRRYRAGPPTDGEGFAVCILVDDGSGAVAGDALGRPPQGHLARGDVGGIVDVVVAAMGRSYM
jgi:hypothetical protein